MKNLRLNGGKFPYRDTDPEKLLDHINTAYDFLRQFQTEKDALQKQVLNAEEKIRFWRNLTLTGLTGLLAALLAILKAAAPFIVKNLLK